MTESRFPGATRRGGTTVRLWLSDEQSTTAIAKPDHSGAAVRSLEDHRIARENRPV
ncbi:hypothetical protein [Nocardia farcinica]|uniref:hypothetical protein n=1 Tax=Nocardia farcinica TaxID=37329 RepID=UPI0003240343|nr:hypothetical protein [Nocardia farcinica]MBF6291777.1 hypothetical protein [Nocardia farcinica]MBF6573707.1 hypothetical protein [Nocardia farcinica]